MPACVDLAEIFRGADAFPRALRGRFASRGAFERGSLSGGQGRGVEDDADDFRGVPARGIGSRLGRAFPKTLRHEPSRRGGAWIAVEGIHDVSRRGGNAGSGCRLPIPEVRPVGRLRGGAKNPRASHNKPPCRYGQALRQAKRDAPREAVAKHSLAVEPRPERIRAEVCLQGCHSRPARLRANGRRDRLATGCRADPPAPDRQQWPSPLCGAREGKFFQTLRLRYRSVGSLEQVAHGEHPSSGLWLLQRLLRGKFRSAGIPRPRLADRVLAGGSGGGGVSLRTRRPCDPRGSQIRPSHAVKKPRLLSDQVQTTALLPSQRQSRASPD